ncbi:MAG TPA: twin-arginine translocase TatA/TatE family subunit [Longimicrobiaceae bacterium]|nr:twin-arginine translocase TatA/TatE family subunit [Longimicrobiaceae bacterium]
MPFGLGMTETLLIFAVLLLFFGAKRLPELAGGLGKGIRDFKRSLNGLDEPSIQAAQAPQVIQAPAQPVAAPVQAQETKVEA